MDGWNHELNRKGGKDGKSRCVFFPSFPPFLFNVWKNKKADLEEVGLVRRGN